MWLLPVLSVLSRLAASVYYRLDVAGPRVPRAGPVLLVANHPNSLLDPALVAAAAGRPVRFLAKAPLFNDRAVGWLVRGAGAIPIFRAQDDPARMEQNESVFRAVYAALAQGAAIGIFPEGISHSEPGLQPLKTGAARMVLGAYNSRGARPALIPVGLSFRDKHRFRSPATVCIGDEIPWEDLTGGRGAGDAGAVRELTGRITAAMRRLTVNLEAWEDASVVEYAEAVHRQAFAGPLEPGDMRARQNATAELLAAARQSADPAAEELSHEVRRHARALGRLGWRPQDLENMPGTHSVLRWGWRHSLPVAALLAPLAALGVLFFYLPYRLPGWLADRTKPAHDVRATYQMLTGSVAMIIWLLVWLAMAGLAGGIVAALAALLAIPAFGLITLWARDRWTDAGSDARRFFSLRRGDRLRRGLHERQQMLAADLEALRGRLSGSQVR